MLWFILYRSFFDSFNHWITRFWKKRTWFKIYPLHITIHYPHWENSALKLSSEVVIWQANLQWSEDYAKLTLREKCPNTEVFLVIRRSSWSKYKYWNIISTNKTLNVSWEILGTHKSYNQSSKRCPQCLNEKLAIALHKDDNMLNKRSELINKCRHRNKYMLVSYDSKD